MSMTTNDIAAQDPDLQTFLKRDEHLAPVGFVMRMLSVCIDDKIGSVQKLREQRRNAGFKYAIGIGKKTLDHLDHLFLTFDAGRQDTNDVKTCQWCNQVHDEGYCPRIKSIEYYESSAIKSIEFFPLEVTDKIEED
jgi:hypothetical protein